VDLLICQSGLTFGMSDIKGFFERRKHLVKIRRMSQLVLVTGFKDEAGGTCSSGMLEESLKALFPSQSEVWMDPSKKPRAVIFFEEKLDAVLETCRQTWRVEEQTLSVIPYFKCFKEPFEAQLQRLTPLNNVASLVESSTYKKSASSAFIG
jgi:hypothetical protein